MKYECYFDGGITFNPGGDMTIGGVVYEVDGNTKNKIYEFSDKFYSKDFPDGTSNNVAEAMALDKILSFFILENNTHHHICIYGDSQIVINRAKSRRKDGKGIFRFHHTYLISQGKIVDTLFESYYSNEESRVVHKNNIIDCKSKFVFNSENGVLRYVKTGVIYDSVVYEERMYVYSDRTLRRSYITQDKNRLKKSSHIYCCR